MNFIKKNRLKAKLSVSEMANKLDIPYIKYKSIDEGFVKMPTNLMDKFNEIVGNIDGTNNIEKLNREQLVNEWWEEMCQKQAHGTYKLNEKMEEFNIPTLKRLSELLGYKSTGALSGYLSGKHPAGYEAKHKVYSFFENELNIQDPRSNKKGVGQGKGGGRKPCTNQELVDWYKTFDVLNWLNTHHITQPEFARKIGMSKSTFYYFVKQKSKGRVPTAATIRTVKNKIENWDNTLPQEVVEDNLINNLVKNIGSTSPENNNIELKERLINKYETKIKNIENDIKQFAYQLEKLEEMKNLYEQVLNDINED